eukprot:COSAG01_NODE_4330_length_5126_cov_21.673494_4_plen_95_part_00
MLSSTGHNRQPSMTQHGQLSMGHRDENHIISIDTTVRYSQIQSDTVRTEPEQDTDINRANGTRAIASATTGLDEDHQSTTSRHGPGDKYWVKTP